MKTLPVLYKIELLPTALSGIWKLRIEYEDYVAVCDGRLSALYNTLGEIVLQHPQPKEGT